MGPLLPFGAHDELDTDEDDLDPPSNGIDVPADSPSDDDDNNDETVSVDPRRPCKIPNHTSDPISTVETSRTKLNDSDLTPQPTRRLIKADLSLLNISSFDQDDDDFLNSPSPDVIQKEFPGSPSADGKDGKSPWQRTVTLDLARHGRVALVERRHSITLCDLTPARPTLTSPSEHSCLSLTPKSSRASTTATLLRSVSNSHRHRGHLKYECMSQDERKHIQWKHSLECLSLTLEEVVHIRNQLTKAELESLLVDTPQYVDVAKGKLCFICKRTKFGFFGPWGQKCKLCKRIVCEKCCSKMRIPTEHFARIPVYTLSPSPTSSSDEDSSPRSSWRMPELPTLMPNSAGSAPSSPMTPARGGREPQEAQPSSLPTIPATPDTPCVDASDLGAAPATAEPPPASLVPRRGPLLRSRTLQRPDRGGRQEKLCGSLMNVCKECKAMVCHIIVASHNSLVLKQKSDRIAATFPRRIKAPTDSAAPSRDLNLNLSPIY